MMSDEYTEWTVDELVSELRARERARAGSATRRGAQAMPAAAPKGEPHRGVPGVIPRFRRLSDLPSAEIVTLVNVRQRAIYGVDDRKETFAVTDKKAQRLADASVALVEAADLTRSAAGGWQLTTTSYKAEYHLCSQEPFAAQPLGCFCSGVLVAPDVIATAGHCVKSTHDLAHIRFVFGFRMIDDHSARVDFPRVDVYEGREVIGRQFTSDATDWALVRLDRRVTGRKPVAIRTLGKLANTEPLLVIGHPCGLPQKFADGARVRSNTPRAYFVANLDTYGGNSGSPVFSGRTYQLEGLLVRGQKDFVSTGSCNVSVVFPTTGRGGEEVTRSTEWARLVATKQAEGTRDRKRASPGGKARPSPGSATGKRRR